MESPNTRLIVVSNRLPANLRLTSTGWRAEKSTGGLATAMSPILRRSRGVWVGWPGDSEGIADPGRQLVLNRWKTEDGLIAVEIPAETARHFYEGYANQTLWPLFHHFPSRLTFDPGGWAAYKQANLLFRDAVLGQYREGDLIWVHDYQLMLLPSLLREALPNAAIGFFLHIPFPSSEVFRILPERTELLDGLLGSDLVAFHTYSYLQHFRSSLLRVHGRESRLDEVDLGGRTVRLDALPIGIAPEEFTKLLSRAEGKRRVQKLKQRYRGRQLVLAVDRMDYTKGIPERLRTYRRLLDQTPELRGKVVLLQIAVPSREQISSYDALRHVVNELVGEINGQFATPDWTPVEYIRRGISRAELVALYAVADVAWVSPLRDGMNLVSKEYVACQVRGDGVLILSEFAGAAEEMGEAVIVNPNDEERTGRTVAAALRMPIEERRRRMATLRERVHRNDVFAWSEGFLGALSKAAGSRGDSLSERPPGLDTARVVAAYRSCTKRLFLLDYDGTLTPYFNRPEDAAPSAELMNVLGDLASVSGNSVMIISGRGRADMERWFGDLDALWMAAEHGALLRRPGSVEWEPYRIEHSRRWMQRVRPVLQHFVDRTQGSFIEEKEFSLVWHYRMSEARFSDWLAQELAAMLDEMLAETELRAIRGNKTVEVRPGWLHKGATATRFVALCGPAEFQFAAGDDRTDEDMFQALDASVWTVRVGPGRSRARFAVSGPTEVAAILRNMATER
jgi:trehalose 6-phosphate synthase/phosphatase